MTGEICAGTSGPAMCQLTGEPSASCTSMMPGPAKPAGAPTIAPGYDAMPSMSSGVSPASAIAASAASA
jgi:hypothetical protein